jgi:hypothetical protein
VALDIFGVVRLKWGEQGAKNGMSCDYIPPLPVKIEDEREEWMDYAEERYDECGD